MSGCDLFCRDNDYFEAFKFTYTGEGRNITYEATKDIEYWPDVLDKFLDFLSSVYGYDIRSNVTITEPAGDFKFYTTNEDTTS
mgnify:CR=1 FL=1